MAKSTRNIKKVGVLGASGNMGSVSGGIFAQTDIECVFFARSADKAIAGLKLKSDSNRSRPRIKTEIEKHLGAHAGLLKHECKTIPENKKICFFRLDTLNPQVHTKIDPGGFGRIGRNALRAAKKKSARRKEVIGMAPFLRITEILLLFAIALGIWLHGKTELLF